LYRRTHAGFCVGLPYLVLPNPIRLGSRVPPFGRITKHKPTRLFAQDDVGLRMLEVEVIPQDTREYSLMIRRYLSRFSGITGSGQLSGVANSCDFEETSRKLDAAPANPVCSDAVAGP